MNAKKPHLRCGFFAFGVLHIHPHNVNTPALCFSVLGREFPVSVANEHLRTLLVQNFSAFQTDIVTQPAFFKIYTLPGNRLTLESARSGVIWQSSDNSADNADDYFFLYALEKELTLELQRTRPNLYFVHAAVLERNRRCILIAAESGTGKSTTAYALQKGGFRYMSDELAPIEVATASVFPYRHSLCLKTPPPSPFADLPEHFATERTLHIPVRQLNQVDDDRAVPLSTMVFLHRSHGNDIARMRSISPAEAAARLYGNTLNALAHANSGIDAATAIARQVPAYHLDAGNLADTCRLLDELEI